MNLVTTVLGVFTVVSEWLITNLTDVISLFWDSTNGLTFFGMLALVPLAISVVMMLFAIVRSYLHFRA